MVVDFLVRLSAFFIGYCNLTKHKLCLRHLTYPEAFLYKEAAGVLDARLRFSIYQIYPKCICVLTVERVEKCVPIDDSFKLELLLCKRPQE